MLQNTRAQKLSDKWCQHQGSALHAFGLAGIYNITHHRLYLSEVQQQIDLPETALFPFTRPAKDNIELEQLKHFFEQKGLQSKIVTVWKNDYYGFPVPFTEQEYPFMLPVKRLV